MSHPFDLIRCRRCRKPAAEWVTRCTHESCQLCEPCYQARLLEPKLQANPDRRVGYVGRYQDERAPDGRNIYDEMCGSYKRQDYERKEQ